MERVLRRRSMVSFGNLLWLREVVKEAVNKSNHAIQIALLLVTVPRTLDSIFVVAVADCCLCMLLGLWLGFSGSVTCKRMCVARMRYWIQEKFTCSISFRSFDLMPSQGSRKSLNFRTSIEQRGLLEKLLVARPIKKYYIIMGPLYHSSTGWSISWVKFSCPSALTFIFSLLSMF
jgi:hypothetical protein